MWQTGVVIIVLTVAVGYAVYRVYRMLTNRSDTCEGCALKDSCKKHGVTNGSHADGTNGKHDCCKNNGHTCPNC